MLNHGRICSSDQVLHNQSMHLIDHQKLPSYQIRLVLFIVERSRGTPSVLECQYSQVLFAIVIVRVEFRLERVYSSYDKTFTGNAKDYDTKYHPTGQQLCPIAALVIL